jgi:hypothetical protein
MARELRGLDSYDLSEGNPSILDLTLIEKIAAEWEE